MESDNRTNQLSTNPQTSELFASVLFDSIDDSITVQDAEYNVIRINRAVERIFGKDVLGKKCYRAYQGRNDICPDCPTQKVWAGGQRSFSSQQTGVQGTTFEIWAFPVMDAGGKTIAVLEHGRDITERVKAAEDLQKSEALYHDLVETTQDLIWQCDSEGKYTYLNHSWEDVFGYRIEEMLGRPFSDFQSPEQAERDLEQLRKIMSQDPVKGYETVHIGKDGTEINLVFNAKAWRNKQGTVAGTMGAAYDITARKRAEKALLDTQIFLNNILDSSTRYSIIGLDLDQRILSWNEGARLNYGYTASEVIGRRLSILHTPDSIKSGHSDKMLKTVLEKGIAEAEVERIRKDGSRFIASVVITRRDDSAGSPIGYLAISCDITEKTRSEQALRNASIYARSLIEASLDPLVTINAEGKITDVNTATENATGRTRQQLTGSDFADYFTEPEKARDGYRQVFSQGSVRDYPLTLRHSSGRTMDVLYNASTYRNEAGVVQGVFAAARDITERNEWRMLKAIITSMTEGLMVTDSSRTLTYLNPAAETILGVNSIDFVNKPITLFVDTFLQRVSEPDKVRANWKEAFSRLDQMPVIHVQMKNGQSRREIDLTLFPVGSPSNRLGVGVLSRDVSREHEIDRMKSEFISTVSHELRTPMTSIFGFSELLLMRTKNLPDNQRMWVETIHRETGRLSSIVEDLLNVSRIEAGRLSLNIEPVDIGPLAAGVVDQIQTSHPSRSFHLDIPECLPRVQADEDKLKQALYNLLDNAVKYSPDGGSVKVTALEEPGKNMVIVSISDRGLGIPEEEISRLFTRFHRVERPNLPRVTGNGLGLYITRALVEMMGGRIWVESKVDEGSTFHFSLPAVAAGDTSAKGFDTMSPAG